MLLDKDRSYLVGITFGNAEEMRQLGGCVKFNSVDVAKSSLPKSGTFDGARSQPTMKLAVSKIYFHAKIIELDQQRRARSSGLSG